MSGCGCDGHGLKPVDEALAELLARAPAPPAVESVALADALGRVLASEDGQGVAWYRLA